MPHEGFAYVGHDAGFHEPGVKGVAKIVEAEGTNPGPTDGCLPRGLDPMERTAFECENQAVGFHGCREQIDEPRSERDLASFSLSGFRVGNREHSTIQVNVFKTLG
jgi:hypothetical protein